MQKKLNHIRITMLMATALAFCACQESIDQRFAREAKEYTEKKCPIAVDPVTRLDSVTYNILTRTRTEYYTLHGEADDVAIIKGLKLNEVLLQQFKNAPVFKDYRQEGCNYRCVYRSMSRPGTILEDVMLTKEDYQ